jgi:hypothetical protein
MFTLSWLTLLLSDMHAGIRDSAQLNFLVGLSAGSLNGIVLSPISVIKYHGWGTDPKATFRSAARDILVKGGPNVFFKGVSVVMMRDGVFGIVYELIRGSLRTRDPSVSTIPLSALNFGADFVAASAASIISSPLNYCRNIKYSVPPECTPPSVLQCLRALVAELKAHNSPIRFLESRLYLGWGTARVGIGMAIGQSVYENAKELLGPVL